MPRQRFIGFTVAAVVAAGALSVGYGIAADAQGTRPVPDATAGLTRQVNLTPAEELTQSEAFIVRMDSARTGVRRQLETARAQRDVVKTLCLNDKLNQIDVAVRSARERREALQAAVQRSDADLANHEFNILSVLRQRSDQLTAEANQCIGQDTGFIGDNVVTSTVDPGIPEDPWPMLPPTIYGQGEPAPQPPVPVSAVK
jgi:hypothetical protein